LSLSPTHHPCSQSSSRCSDSDSDMFEDWPEANNMVSNVYVSLTTDASSYHVSTVGGLHDGQEFCAGGSSYQRSHSRAASSKKPQRWRSAPTGALWRKLKKSKIVAEHALIAPASCLGSLSATNFDKSEWETTYPLFVQEGLVDPSKRVNRKNA
jgi:hypothetical protein